MSVAKARALRCNATAAESMLWHALRDRGLGGHKFRRQHRIGPYVVDFVCLARGFAVELDGGQHAASPARAKDKARSAWLASRGFRVIRFWNNEVTANLEGVLARIESELAQAPERTQPLRSRPT